MAVSSPAAPLTPTGGLRAGLVGTGRQFLGANLSSIAAFGLIGLMVAAWIFDALWLYSEPTPLGEQGHTLGPGFAILAVLILIATPGRVVPRRVSGSLIRALASGPEFRRRVHTELHGAEVYKARRYLPSVVVLALLWIGCAALYYSLLRDAWADPAVTMHTGAQVTGAVIAVGILAVLLMLPGRSRRTVLVDDEGRFFTDTGDASAPAEPAAAVAAVPVQPAAAPAAVPVQPVQPLTPAESAVPAAPVAVQPATPPARNRRGRMAIGVVVGVLATVLVLVGAVAFYVLRAGEARSPSAVADMFGQAKVKCLDFDVLADTKSVKTLGCRTDDAQLITITTYGNRPDADQWVSDTCQASEGSAARLRRGYYLVGEDFILDMHQLRHPKYVTPTPMDRTATRLARVLDAAAVPYNCNR